MRNNLQLRWPVLKTELNPNAEPPQRSEWHPILVPYRQWKMWIPFLSISVLQLFRIIIIVVLIVVLLELVLLVLLVLIVVLIVASSIWALSVSGSTFWSLSDTLHQSLCPWFGPWRMSYSLPENMAYYAFWKFPWAVRDPSRFGVKDSIICEIWETSSIFYSFLEKFLVVAG